MCERYLTRPAAAETESESSTSSSSSTSSLASLEPVKTLIDMSPPSRSRPRSRTRAGPSATPPGRTHPRGRKPLTLTDCEALYHLPVERAAAALGVSRPTIARVMRANGVARWPYRAYRAEMNRAEKSRRTSSARTAPRRRASLPRRAATAPGAGGDPMVQPPVIRPASPPARGLGRGGAGKSISYAQPSGGGPSGAGSSGRRSRPVLTGAAPARRMESIRRRADDAARAAAEAARSPPVASTATSTIVASALSPAASSSSTPANSPPTHPTLPRARPRAALQDSGLLDALEADRAALRAVFGIPGWGEVSGQDEDFGSVFSPTPAVKPEVFLEREATDIPADVLVELLGAEETVVAPTGAEGTGGDAGAGAGFLTV